MMHGHTYIKYPPHLPRALFPTGLPIKTLYAPLTSPLSATSPTNVIILVLITRIRFGEEYRSLSFSFQSLVTASPFGLQ